MITLQDLTQNDVISLEGYFDTIVCLYLNDEPGNRKKALRMYEKIDNTQMHDWKEFLKGGSFPYSLAEEIEDFMEGNVKA